MFGFVAKVYKALAKRVTLDEAVGAVDNGKGTVYAESSRYRSELRHLNNCQFRIEWDRSLDGGRGRSIFLKRFGDSDYLLVGAFPTDRKIVWHLYDV